MSDVSATLAERGGRYGAFIDHATIAQRVQDAMRMAPNWDKLDPDMKQALVVFSDKIARILNGDPWYEDNWHDIQGYARLVEMRIQKIRKEEAEAAMQKQHGARLFPNNAKPEEVSNITVPMNGTIGRSNFVGSGIRDKTE